MYVLCKDLLNLNSFSDCHILTGEKGLNRVISWPYMAKALLEDDLFTGGEFVIIAETYVKYDEQSLLDFVDICVNKEISGILIFVNKNSDGLKEVPQSFVDKCFDNNIPVFELPWDIRCIDVIKEISILIFENSQRNNALLSCLKNLIFFYDTIDDAHFQQLINLGYNDIPYYFLRIQFVNFEEYCKYKNLNTEYKMHEQKIFLRHYIIGKINDYLPNIYVCANSNIIAGIIPIDKFADTVTIEKNIENLFLYLKEMLNPLDAKICLSQKFASILELREAFHETTHIIQLGQLPTFSNRPVFYNKLGIYKLLITSTKQNLFNIYNSTMKSLIEFDRENDADLINTLSIYLANNLSLDATSKQLYIHSNTIRYRLKKIEALTGMSLKSTNDLSMFCYCIHIKEYLQIVE
ncbi:MAG: PucR family transcriptional regulator [Clostridiales bacterium]|nr:PucR family transcriptional regulator [Clostridiales bacterium]